jgi:molybdopterin/thiamine biosynthesis adenylyltransferase
MIDIRNRFKDAPWFPTHDIYCVVGGAGGIGSWLTFLLSRVGYKAIVFDFDIVEAHNIGGQLYGKSHIGKHKVVALKEIIEDFCDIDLEIHNEAYTPGSMTGSYVFSAFDNMKARRDMFERWLLLNSSNPNAIFIDGRLTMEQLQVFCVTPDQAEMYREDHLFDDSEVADAPCTLKQTSHSAAMIASEMTAFFTNHITNVKEENKVRSTPFFQEYFIPLNLTTSGG